MELGARSKKILLAAAAVLVLAAICLCFIPDANSYAWVHDSLLSHGISVNKSSLNYEGNASNTSIRMLLSASEEKIAEAVSASRENGFSSDIDAVGNVVLMTAKLANDELLTVYIFENQETSMQIELCFIQNSKTGEVRS